MNRPRSAPLSSRSSGFRPARDFPQDIQAYIDQLALIASTRPNDVRQGLRLLLGQLKGEIGPDDVVVIVDGQEEKTNALARRTANGLVMPDDIASSHIELATWNRFRMLCQRHPDSVFEVLRRTLEKLFCPEMYEVEKTVPAYWGVFTEQIRQRGLDAFCALGMGMDDLGVGR